MKQNLKHAVYTVNEGVGGKKLASLYQTVFKCKVNNMVKPALCLCLAIRL